MSTNNPRDYRNDANLLFEKWKASCGSVKYSVNGETQSSYIDHKHNVFIKDGVVCPEQWFSQKIRPLFLLKEAYGGTEDWDLVNDHLCSNKKIEKMWQRLSLWTKGLFSTSVGSIPPFEEKSPDTAYYGNDYLKKIAVINIKKSSGKKTSNIDLLRAYGEFDKTRLKKQLELCNPTLIICGYTASILDSIMGYSVREERNPNLHYTIQLKGRDVTVIDYWHPANQFPDLMNYYSLMSIYQLSLKKML